MGLGQGRGGSHLWGEGEGSAPWQPELKGSVSAANDTEARTRTRIALSFFMTPISVQLGSRPSASDGVNCNHHASLVLFSNQLEINRLVCLALGSPRASVKDLGRHSPSRQKAWRIRNEGV